MPRRRLIVAVLAVLVAGGAVVAFTAFGGEDGLDHVIDVADLGDCATVERPAGVQPARSWKRASETGTVHCEAFGGHLQWARFPDAATLRRSMAARPSRAPVCVYGTEVVVHHLTVEPDPTTLCDALGGQLLND